MKKELIIQIFLIITSIFFTPMIFSKEWRTLSKERGQISCPLYKNRLEVSLQRLNEFDYAEKVKKRTFKIKEYQHLIDLFQRHEIPFLENEVLFFEKVINLTRREVELIKHGRTFKVDSPFFRFSTDRLAFPTSALELDLDEENGIMKVVMPLNYFQACLNRFELKISIANEVERFSMTLFLDKYNYDLQHLDSL